MNKEVSRPTKNLSPSQSQILRVLGDRVMAPSSITVEGFFDPDIVNEDIKVLKDRGYITIYKPISANLDEPLYLSTTTKSYRLGQFVEKVRSLLPV